MPTVIDKMVKTFDRDYLIFFVARVFGIAVRPLTLICLIQMGFPSEADSLSVLVLAITSFLAVYGLPAHLEFYKYYFSPNSSSKISVPLFHQYISGITGHAFFITPFLFVILVNTGYTVYFASLLVLILIFEKLFDEILRFKLFDKQYISWSALTIVKFAVPIGLFIVHIWINEGSGENVYIKYNFVVYASISALLLGIYYWNGALQVTRLITLRSLVGSTYNFWRSKVSSFIYLAFAPLVLTYDKWYISSLNSTGGLSSLLIISQIGGLSFFFSSMLFVQNRRATLTNENLGIKELLLGFRMLATLLCCFIILNLVLLIYPWIYGDTTGGGSSGVVMIVIGYFCIYSLGEPIFENVFWNENCSKLLIIDALILIFCCFLGYVRNLYSPLVSISWLTLVFFLIRVGVYLVIVRARGKKEMLAGSIS